MEHSAELLLQAEKFAGRTFTPAELSAVLELDEEAINVAIQLKSPLGKAILRGWYKVIYDARGSEILMATHGSTPAQARVATLISRLPL